MRVARKLPVGRTPGRKARAGLVAMGILATAGLVAACSTGGHHATSSSPAHGAAGLPDLSGTDYSTQSGDGTASAGGSRTAAGGVPGAGVPEAAGKSSTTLVTDTRSLIRIADLAVTVKDATAVASQANQAEELVAGSGGEVFTDDRTSGANASAVLQLKVPPAQLSPMLTKLAALGKERSRSLSSRDVTTQVADVSARLTSAQDSITRLRTLYANAVKVSDVIAIEDELSTRESDLESLEAQQRSLSSETSFATINLTIDTIKAKVPPKKHHKQGVIVRGLHNGWHHFTSAASWIVAALATLLPFAVLVALVLGVLGWTRRRRSTPVLGGDL